MQDPHASMSSVALLPASYLNAEEEADLGKMPCSDDEPRFRASTFDHTRVETPRKRTIADYARAVWAQLTWANCQLSVVFLLFVVLRAMDRVFNKRVIDRMKSAQRAHRARRLPTLAPHAGVSRADRQPC